jgi:hypothetical protein
VLDGFCEGAALGTEDARVGAAAVEHEETGEVEGGIIVGTIGAGCHRVFSSGPLM